MAEQKAKQAETKIKSEGETLRDTASTWSDTIREAVETITDSAVALQDRNVKYAQSLVDQGFEQLEHQTATLHKAFNTLTGQSAKRRAAFRHLFREAVVAPRKLYQETLAAVRDSADTSAESKA
jgi:hypothetical protein